MLFAHRSFCTFSISLKVCIYNNNLLEIIAEEVEVKTALIQDNHEKRITNLKINTHTSIYI